MSNGAMFEVMWDSWSEGKMPSLPQQSFGHTYHLNRTREGGNPGAFQSDVEPAMFWYKLQKS